MPYKICVACRQYRHIKVNAAICDRCVAIRTNHPTDANPTARIRDDTIPLQNLPHPFTERDAPPMGSSLLDLPITPEPATYVDPPSTPDTPPTDFGGSTDGFGGAGASGTFE